MSDIEVSNSPEVKVTHAVGLVAVNDGKILLVEHGEGAGHLTGVYGLPAGRLDSDDEAHEDAAVREFGEETGLAVKREDLKEFPDNYYEANITRKDGTIMRAGMRVYKVARFTGELREGNEETTPMWKSLEEVRVLEAEGKLLPNVISAIEAGMREYV